jgi:hypothetical protein
MGFYFRKSFGNGPFRINLSKSGISYSFGRKGARINVSRRGTYVNFGSGSLYYRKKISGFGEKVHTKNYSDPPVPALTEPHSITSADVEQITDSDSNEFIHELTHKANKISYHVWFGIIPLIVTTVVYFYIFCSKTETEMVETEVNNYYVKASIDSKINVRQQAEKTSKIIGVINPGEQYGLLDSSNPGWYDILYAGREGFVSRKVTAITSEISHRAEYASDPAKYMFETKSTLFCISFLSLFAFFVILLNVLRNIDKKRLLVQIHYDIDEQVNEVYQKFIHHFAEVFNCARLWQYLHSQQTNDYKYTSGAANIISRKLLTNISVNKKPSKFFITNIQIPYLGLKNTELYFFPERLIIKRGSQYGGIMYKNVDCFERTTQFIESETVPGDSVVIGHTWRYLNKNGGPDRRFINNRQIPICQYSEYSFQSSSGLNERIATSKVGVFDNFVRYIKAIGQLQAQIGVDTSGQ